MVQQNLHCHTTFDDGASTPEEMVCAAMEHGLSSLCLLYTSDAADD